jgi:multisite-specific tRNA:(cytosine-C5)-methyltransferase
MFVHIAAACTCGADVETQKNGRRKPKENAYRLDLIEKSDMDNEQFNAYYKAQHVVSDDEWNVMMEALRRVLPTSFRVTGSRQCVAPVYIKRRMISIICRTAQELNQTIRDDYVPTLGDAVFEGTPIPAPAQIPWYESRPL